MPTSGGGYQRWLRCAQKTCCSYYVVFPTGDEVVSIARTLGMPIDEVVAALPSKSVRTAYRLSAGGSLYRLALVRTQNDAVSAPACGFLAQLPDGATRCGLGPLRPRRCQTYPAILRDGQIDVDAAGCACEPWSVHEVDSPIEATQLTALAIAYKRYADVVATWNSQVRDPYTHADFFAYLREEYVE